MTPILITGATGKVGSATARLLQSRGVPVRAVVRDRDRAAAMLPGIELVKADLGDAAALRPALEGVERMLLISSAAPDMGDLQDGVVDAAAAAGVRFLVKLSGLDAGADPSINLARWHGQTEERMRRSGMGHCFLRPAGFMQNLLAFAPAFQYGVLETCRTDGEEALVDARDIAAVAAAVLECGAAPSEALSLTGPETLTIDAIAARLSEVAGRPLQVARVSEDAYLARLLGFGLPEWMIEDLIAWGRQKQPVSPAVGEVLGRPATPLSQFLADHAAVFRG